MKKLIAHYQIHFNKYIMKQPYIVFFLLITLCGCNQQLIIKPLNEDRHIFTLNKSVFHYYQLDNYKTIPNNVLLDSLKSYLLSNYSFQEIYGNDGFAAYFYKKRPFVNYRKHIIESIHKNDWGGSIYGYEALMIAQIYYMKEGQSDSIVVKRILYEKGFNGKKNILLLKSDSIDISHVKRHL